MLETVEAVLLLGWMTREDAVTWLCNEAVPPMAEGDAVRLWEEKTRAVEALSVRPVAAPTQIDLNHAEKKSRDNILRALQQAGNRDIQDIVKIDPAGLAIYQFRIVLDRVAAYQPQVKTALGWMATALPTHVTNPPLQGRFTQMGLRTEIDLPLPHGEFFFLPVTLGNDVAFAPSQGGRAVTVARSQGGMLLQAGYHRTYARFLNAREGDTTARAVLVAFNRTVFPATPSQSPGINPLVALLTGLRAPRFGDFFDERLVIKLKLRKLRYELQVRADVVPIAVES